MKTTTEIAADCGIGDVDDHTDVRYLKRMLADDCCAEEFQQQRVVESLYRRIEKLEEERSMMGVWITEASIALDMLSSEVQEGYPDTAKQAAILGMQLRKVCK